MKGKGRTPAFPPLSGCFQKLPIVCVQTKFNFINFAYCSFSPSAKDRTNGIRHEKVAVREHYSHTLAWTRCHGVVKALLW